MKQPSPPSVDDFFTDMKQLRDLAPPVIDDLPPTLNEHGDQDDAPLLRSPDGTDVVKFRLQFDQR